MCVIFCRSEVRSDATGAKSWGWLFRVSPDKHPGDFEATFIEVDYKRSGFTKHPARIAHCKPTYATVPDLSDQAVDLADIARALQQAEQLQQHCAIPLIVPKVSGQLAHIPLDIAIGYSIPTSYGGATYPLWELAGRRVHLLGGSPKKQFEAYRYLSAIAEVISADSNYAQLMATRYAEYWDGRTWVNHPGIKTAKRDLYPECWRWSCRNILAGWRKLCR